MGVTIAPEELRVKTVQSAAGLLEMPSRGDREQVVLIPERVLAIHLGADQ
jgi:hypothetical protein